MNQIGIVADSHDRMDMLHKAVEKLNHMEVDMVLHAGDIVAPFTAKILGKLEVPFRCVYGNNDGERGLLARVTENLDSEIDDFLEVERGDEKIALYHGTDQRILDLIVKSGQYSLVATGHTHRKEIRKEADTLVVNPGEVCGYLTGEPTMAIVALKEGRGEIVEL